MEKWLLILILCSASVLSATVTISNTPVVTQAEDIRLGIHIGNGATRYSTNLYNNFVGNGDFEDNSDWQEYPINNIWNGDVSGLTMSFDTNQFYDGKQSLKVTATSSSVGNGVGQWESYKEYQNGKDYVFSCYMRQDGMALGNNVELMIYITDTGSNCPGGFTARESYPVNSEWQEYQMEFTMDKDCNPRDPAQGGANTKRINLLSAGTLYIDRCTLYDKEEMTPWGINKKYMELLKDLRPITIRYGALDVNELQFEDEVGAIWGRPDDRAGIAEFLQLSKLVGASPDYVLSVVFSDEDYENLMEFMFGPADTEYGSMREQLGYPSFDFDRFYYELGNELMCRSTSMSSPGPCEWPGASYGDWSTPRINLFKDSPYWDESRDKIGFNVWYDSSKLNVPTLETESGNTNGGRADFIMPAKYFDGHNAFSIAADGTRIDYTQSQLTSNSDLYFSFNFGTAELMKTYIDYFNELTEEKYGKRLEFGIYEYGPTGYPDGKSSALFNLEKSLAFGVGWLDMSVNMKKYGAEAINIFYYQQGFGSYSWALVDAYPYEHKRPSYYLFSMYGKYIRGEMLERTLDSPTFDPYGPGADQVNSYGCSRGGSNCQNSNWGLTDWKYPVDVPLVEVYPFRYGQRYSFLIINRGMNTAQDIELNLPYNPSVEATLHSVTHSNPEITNENADNVVIQTSAINDFADGYTFTAQPFSAYVIVNYENGAAPCLDEDLDGFGDNEYENDCASSLIDCADFNSNINPGANAYCDCDDSDGFYMGGFEVGDGIDNDCDGNIDNSPQQCLTLNQLVGYMDNWKRGTLPISVLMQKIIEWKGC